MTFLSELDVVNEMLATIGEVPLNSLSDGHVLAPVGQRLLATANVREQSKGWWFNRELSVMTPDTVTGFINLPLDTLRVDPQEPSLHYVQRGRRLYQPYASAAQDKYVFSQPVLVWLVRLIPFVDLPAQAQNVVSYAAQLDFMKAYDADVNKYQEVARLYKDSVLTLNAEHIRNQNANFITSNPLLSNIDSVGAPAVSRWPFIG